MDADSEVMTGVTTLILTTDDVVEIPPAVATDLSATGPALKLLAVMLNGALWREPIKELFAKNATLVTVPPPTVAPAAIATFAGTAKVAPLAGLVTVTTGEGETTAGVERV